MKRISEYSVFVMFSVAFCFIAGPVLAQEKTDLPPGIISKEPAKTFKARVNKINASEKFFEALARQPDQGPIINLNLLRYRPRGNSEIYDRYGAKAGPEILAMGGDIVVHGKANTKTEKIFEFNDAWDGVAFVLYPRRSSYIQLQRSEAYQDGIADRVACRYLRKASVCSQRR